MTWHKERFEEDPARVRFDCVSCARPMWFPASKVGKYKTCSQECATSKRTKATETRTRACATCGEMFTPRHAQLRADRGRFCSQKCNTAARTAVNAPEARARAVATRRARFASGELQGLVGEKNPRWAGGRAAHAAKRRAEASAYKRRNPEKVREWAATRRRKGIGKAPRGAVRELLVLQRGKCAICQLKLPKCFHLDHIQPVAAGGTNERTNFQLLCPKCNTQKGAKDPVDFMRSRGFLL